MAWGRMDDGFDDHEKVVALLDEEDLLTAAAAIGLWTLCWTWAHRNTRKRGRTPGLLPAGLPRRFIGQFGKDAAQLLVKHKLWEPQDDGGWIIHDFADYLPTEDVRDARSEAGKLGAAKRWAEKHAAEAAAREAEMANSHDPDGNLPSACHEPDSNAMASDGSRAPAPWDPIPTPIPIPTKKTSSSSAAQKRGTRIPKDFTVTPEMVAWATANCPGVDGRRETAKFINHWLAKTGRDATKLDWVATWRNWIMNAADRLPAGRASPGTDVAVTGTAKPSTSDLRSAAALEAGVRLQAQLEGITR